MLRSEIARIVYLREEEALFHKEGLDERHQKAVETYEKFKEYMETDLRALQNARKLKQEGV